MIPSVRFDDLRDEALVEYQGRLSGWALHLNAIEVATRGTLDEIYRELSENIRKHGHYDQSGGGR